MPLLTRVTIFVLCMLVFLPLSACTGPAYSPHPIHTRITSDHYNKLQYSIERQSQRRMHAQQPYSDNDSTYYLRHYNRQADNAPYYYQPYTPPVIVQTTPNRGNTTIPRPTISPSNKATKGQAPFQDNDSTYYLNQLHGNNADNPIVTSPTSPNQNSTIIVIPTPQMAAPVPSYPIDNDADYYMNYDYAPPPMRRNYQSSPNNRRPNTNSIDQDLQLFFNDS